MITAVHVGVRPQPLRIRPRAVTPRAVAADDTPPTARSAAEEDEVVIALSESLMVDGLADVRWMLHDALVAGARRIVVDLSGVHQLSSSALASFLWAHRTCRARGGGVALRGADRRTSEMLRRTGLWRVLEVRSGRARSHR